MQRVDSSRSRKKSHKKYLKNSIAFLIFFLHLGDYIFFFTMQVFSVAPFLPILPDAPFAAEARGAAQRSLHLEVAQKSRNEALRVLEESGYMQGRTIVRSETLQQIPLRVFDLLNDLLELELEPGERVEEFKRRLA